MAAVCHGRGRGPLRICSQPPSPRSLPPPRRDEPPPERTKGKEALLQSVPRPGAAPSGTEARRGRPCTVGLYGACVGSVHSNKYLSAVLTATTPVCSMPHYLGTYGLALPMPTTSPANRHRPVCKKEPTCLAPPAWPHQQPLTSLQEPSGTWYVSLLSCANARHYAPK